ncbi:MAG: hypothetical protein H0W72_02845 [Planctomycetes bacterium]|nr:hypothetical protein [Planctomycetota bacterium]
MRAHRPDDAIAVLGLTATDLWPGEEWNFVFGMATYDQRVGVWSVARFGDPAQDRLGLLRRMLKTALHETGHMFTMHHCTAWNCLMSGSNNLRETDRRTMDACPECTAKIWVLSGCDPAARFQALAKLAGEHDLDAEQAQWLKAAETLVAP